MEIRTEINNLADNIRAAASSYQGGSKIRLGTAETMISDLSKSLLGDPAKGIKGKLDIYESSELSLKGRIETASNLQSALEELKSHFPPPCKSKTSKKTRIPVHQLDLTNTIKKVTQIVSTATQEQQALVAKVPGEIYLNINKHIQKNYVDLSLTEKIKKNAYRTIKDVSGLQERFNAKHIGGAYQVVSFLTLQQDLETFLSSYKTYLTDKQRSLIADLIPLLAKSAEIDKEIVRLQLLRLNTVDSNGLIESGIADIAYDVEKSIDSLKEGETFIFPGGFTSSKSSHSILYEVQKVREDEYHFSIFNTGLGALFGQGYLQGLKIFTLLSNQFRVPVFTKLNKDSLVDRKFLMDLMRFQIMDTPHQMAVVHETILKQFKERFSAELTTREPHDLQSWGTCSFDSVASFLEYKLPPSLFIPFQYDMMLRARGELNILLPQGEKDRDVLNVNMTSPILKFIDQKSCETISDWKTKFDEYCAPYGKEDLTLARIVKIQNMRDQNDLKKLLERWSDHDIADEKDVSFYERMLETSMKHASCPAVTGLLSPTTMTDHVKCAAHMAVYLPIVSLTWPLNLIDRRIEGLGLHTINAFSFRHRKRLLWRFQELMGQISPEAAKILENRNQALGSGNQLVLGNEIDLSGVFNYLKTRYEEEIALCAPSLLNPNFSPLQEAIVGCSTQLPETQLYVWQDRTVAVL